MLYSNTNLRCISFDGDTKNDIVIRFWHNMKPLDRYKVMVKVERFKSLDLRERACINYIYDNFDFDNNTIELNGLK